MTTSVEITEVVNTVTVDAKTTVTVSETVTTVDVTDMDNVVAVQEIIETVVPGPSEIVVAQESTLETIEAGGIPLHGSPLHNLGTPVAIGLANAGGSGLLSLRDDHIHAHPVFATGKLHTEYGPLADANVWAALQTFNAGITVSGDARLKNHGSVGAGALPTTSRILNVGELFSPSTPSPMYGGFFQPTARPSSGSVQVFGLAGIAVWQGTGTATGNKALGLDFIARHNSSRALLSMKAIQAKQQSLSGGSGAILAGIGIDLITAGWAGSAPNTMAGIRVQDQGDGSIDVLNAFYIEPQTGAITATRNIYQKGVVGANVFVAPTLFGADALPATSALLDMISTTRAPILPRMTTTQRDALTAADGMLLYNTTLAKFQGYENGAWANLI